MATTYEAIATVTVGSGGAASIEFTNIPQTYTDLKIVYSLRNATSNVSQLFMSINGSTANFSRRNLVGFGSGSASSFSGNDNEAGQTNPNTYTTSTFANGEIYIANYTSSNNKSISLDAVTEQNASDAIQYLGASLWSQTASITSVALLAPAGNFVQYSTATLYGIKKD